jgi:threonine synthase
VEICNRRYPAGVDLTAAFQGLRCFACETAHDPAQLQTVCTACGLPIRVDYRLTPETMPRDSLRGRVASLWRYREVLPLARGEVSLGEGFTPLVQLDERTFIKDEAQNPTGSFKARGMTAAVSMARQLGARALMAPSAGNAAGALAAYGAAAKLPVVVAMPDDTPRAFVDECRHYGAEVKLVPGTIADAGKWLREHGPKDAFDVSTLKEPYRVEGKKTMGYELWEQFGGELPDVILYPTGGGVGLIGMCKAFDEMQEMGWIGADRPRMVAVQATGCAPIVKAWEAQKDAAEFFANAATMASGLRVPGPLGDRLILRMLRQTGGTALTVSDEEMLAAGKELASLEGIFAAPEGAATVSAARKLAASGWIRREDRVVLFNTGTGYKYAEAWGRALGACREET